MSHATSMTPATAAWRWRLPWQRRDTHENQPNEISAVNVLVVRWPRQTDVAVLLLMKSIKGCKVNSASLVLCKMVQNGSLDQFTALFIAIESWPMTINNTKAVVDVVTCGYGKHWGAGWEQRGNNRPRTDRQTAGSGLVSCAPIWQPETWTNAVIQQPHNHIHLFEWSSETRS